MVNCQPEAEEKQRLLSIIESKLSIEFTIAQLRQELEDKEVEIGVLQCGADILAKKSPLMMILSIW